MVLSKQKKRKRISLITVQQFDCKSYLVKFVISPTIFYLDDVCRGLLCFGLGPILQWVGELGLTHYSSRTLLKGQFLHKTSAQNKDNKH